ncbi:MAG: hypothetical protein IJQ21_10825 [Lachnospiraceae bacterium]|nr:hypothetical protein [Lachnospiraceae bacterium]
MKDLIERFREDAAGSTEISSDTGLDGFAGLAPKSFAARAVGVYKATGTGAKGDSYEERLEVYSVGGNLYALQSGEGFRAIELIAKGWDGFALTDTDEISVSVLSFSVQSNLSQYHSPTPAGYTMRLTPLLVMNFMPMYNSVTVYRPDDGASCSGTYEIDRVTFEESDGAWITRLRLSFSGIPEDFSGPLYGHRDEAEGYFNLYLGRTQHEDHLLLAETGNGGTTGITDMIFGGEYGVGGSPRFVFGRHRGDLEADSETYEEYREGVMRKNETFYGFVWMDTNVFAQIQPVNPVTFSYGFYGEQRTVLCPMPMESLHTTRYDVVNHGEGVQGSYNCGLFRVVTDAEGTVVSLEELAQYDGDMRGLYKNE